MYIRFDRLMVLPLDGYPVVSIASYSLRLGESANLQELASFGFEPFEIKVVPSKSHTVDPSRVNNLTKSIEVVRIDKARSHYRITYKNISKKKILALRIFYAVPEPRHGGFPEFHMKPLMEPGEIYQAEVDNAPEEPILRDLGYSLDNRGPLEVTVLGVVFDDFTYEGDKEDAIRVAARVRAQQILLPPILSMLKEAETTFRQDKQRAVNKLKMNAALIKTEPEGNVITDLAKRFSPLTENEMGRLSYHLRTHMATEKKDLLERIAIGEYLERTNGGFVPGCTKNGSRVHWLTAQRDSYEIYLRALLSMSLLR